ncbi:MAG: hypothetical protein IM638_03820 [Bacteroidetes bacterium]|jgi:hypothetical protein|nr:hypothetical protein [Bacteroidota bacterium]
MTTSALRKKIHEYIDQVDDSFLIIVHQLLEREVGLQNFELSNEDIETTKRRRMEMQTGKVKGLSHEELMEQMTKTLKTISK